MNYLYIETPIGMLELAEQGGCLCRAALSKPREPVQETETLRQAARQINEYFAGKRQSFDLPLAFAKATPFQVRVWQTLLKIPFGKTVTYGELATLAGCPNAARAVGNAVGKNPLLIVVPCHRVVAANGLGGFSAGIEVKGKLLEHEQAQQEA